MSRNRLEAFSDGVIAVIITIMVLELRAPHGTDWSALAGSIPIFSSYVLSFVFLAIYWNNHHHLMHAVQHVNGAVLWANMHLLFWLSLIPFTTAWMGENHFEQHPVALYGVVLLCCAIAFTILVQALIRLHGRDSVLGRAVGRDRKGYASLALYVTAVVAAFFVPAISLGIYVTVAVIWLVPDRRIERALQPH